MLAGLLLYLLMPVATTFCILISSIINHVKLCCVKKTHTQIYDFRSNLCKFMR